VFRLHRAAPLQHARELERDEAAQAVAEEREARAGARHDRLGERLDKRLDARGHLLEQPLGAAGHLHRDNVDVGRQRSAPGVEHGGTAARVREAEQAQRGGVSAATGDQPGISGHASLRVEWGTGSAGRSARATARATSAACDGCSSA